MPAQGQESARGQEVMKLPGAVEHDISDYLREVNFVERVMFEVLDIGGRTGKILIWGGFCLFNLLLLLLFGTNQPFIREFFALQAELAQFFFLFLGITFLGSLSGLILASNTRRLEELLHRHQQN